MILKEKLESYSWKAMFDIRLHTREWRKVLVEYIDEIKPKWAKKNVRLEITNRKNSYLPQHLDILFDDFYITGRIFINGEEIIFFNRISIIGLSNKKGLVRATQILLNLDSEYKIMESKWSVWFKAITEALRDDE